MIEDVQEFEKKVIEISSKRAQKQSQKPSGRLLKRDRDDEDSNSEHGDGSDSDDDVKPERRRVCFLIDGIWTYEMLIVFFL